MSTANEDDRSPHLLPSDTAAAPTLAYAPAKLFKAQPERVDSVAITFSVLQLGFGFLAIARQLAYGNPGHYVLRDPNWWKWLAWHASGGAWMVWAWAVASLLAVIGAAQPPGRRRRWYAAYTTIWVVGTVACLIGLGVLDNVDVQERWVPANPSFATTWGWQSCHVETSQYVLFPVFFLIANPLLVLFAIRGMRFEPAARTAND